MLCITNDDLTTRRKMPRFIFSGMHKIVNNMETVSSDYDIVVTLWYVIPLLVDVAREGPIVNVLALVRLKATTRYLNI